MMLNLKYSLSTACAVLLASSHALAADVFSANISINGQPSQYVSYQNISDVFDQYRDTRLKSINGYTKGDAFVSTLNLRGWEGAVTVKSDQGSTDLVLSVPSLGIQKVFTGATRNESRKSLFEFFKKGSGDNILKEIVQEAVKYSSADPIIGNPSSLAHTMTIASSSMSDLSLNDLSNIQAADEIANNQINESSSFSILPRFGRYTQNGIDADVFTLPLSYSKWSQEYNLGVVVDTPLTVTKIQDTTSWSGSLGLGLNFMIQPNWYVMPIARIGMASSNDLGASAAIYSAGINSHYIFYPTKKSTISVLNMLSYYKTGASKINDFDDYYDLQNVVIRNGLEYKLKTTSAFTKKPIVTKIQFARTDYTGDEVYSSYSHDLSISIGINNNKKGALLSEYRAGLTYTFGDGNIDGLSVNFGYTF